MPQHSNEPSLQKKASNVLIGILLLLAVSYLDIVTKPEISFLASYILVVLWIANSVGGPIAYVVAVLGAVLRVSVQYIETPNADIFSFAWLLLNVILANCLIVYLITKKNALLIKLEHTTLTDALTGICNRRAFVNRFKIAVAHARRSRIPISIAYIDIDRFKAVNDNFGHEEGDRLLIMVGEILTHHMRLEDMAARLGGDEFVILFEGSDESLVHRVKTSLDQAVLDQGYDVSFSIGVVTYTGRQPVHFEELLHFADELMYSVKRTSKNAICHTTFNVANGRH